MASKKMKFLIFVMMISTYMIEIECNNSDTIKTLSAKIQSLKENVQIHDKQLSARNGFCEMHTNKCGTCTCVEDFDLVEKFYCDCQHKLPQRDCKAHYDLGGARINGVYRITANIPRHPMQVFCDLLAG